MPSWPWLPNTIRSGRTWAMPSSTTLTGCPTPTAISQRLRLPKTSSACARMARRSFHPALFEFPQQLFAFGLADGARNRRPHGMQDLNLGTELLRKQPCPLQHIGGRLAQVN